MVREPDSIEYLKDRVQQLEFHLEKTGKFAMQPLNYKELQREFDWGQLEWRIQHSDWDRKKEKIYATIVAYLTARLIADRLDEVVGPENWQDDYIKTAEGFLCKLCIRTPEGWVTKVDGAPATDVEGFKGGISDAFKRAAVKWGIGRYLYDFDKTYAETSLERTRGWEWAKLKDGTVFWWKAPGPAKSQTIVPAGTDIMDQINQFQRKS